MRRAALRSGSFFPALLERRRCADQALFVVVMEAYLHGVSTRSIDDLVNALGAESGISRSEVSRTCADLDSEVAAFHDRPPNLRCQLRNCVDHGPYGADLGVRQEWPWLLRPACPHASSLARRCAPARTPPVITRPLPQLATAELWWSPRSRNAPAGGAASPVALAVTRPWLRTQGQHIIVGLLWCTYVCGRTA